MLVSMMNISGTSSYYKYIVTFVLPGQSSNLVASLICFYIFLMGKQPLVADYHFVSRDEMENLIQKDAFIEHAIFSGNMYGTRYVMYSAMSICQYGKHCGRARLSAHKVN